MLFQLHIGNAVPEKAAHPVPSLIDSHQMAPAVQLVRRSQARGTGADDRHLFACTHLRRPCMGISHAVGVLNDGQLVALRPHRISVQIAGAGRLAQARADPSCELRKITGLHQAVICFLPVAQIQEIVPLRHHILQWTTGHHTAQHLARLTERHAACHASGPLFLLLRLRQRGMKFIEMPDTLQGRLRSRILTFVIQKACWFSHDRTPYPLLTA